jgi:hypothetical protein
MPLNLLSKKATSSNRQNLKKFGKASKTNENIRGKMDAQDMILDDINRTQFTCFSIDNAHIIYNAHLKLFRHFF